MSFWTYMLECNNGKIYVGHTDNLELRLAEHEQGLRPWCFTYKLRPLRYLWSYEFNERSEAKEFEEQLKGWSRKKKWALIDGGIEAVAKLNKKPRTD